MTLALSLLPWLLILILFLQRNDDRKRLEKVEAGLRALASQNAVKLPAAQAAVPLQANAPSAPAPAIQPVPAPLAIPLETPPEVAPPIAAPAPILAAAVAEPAPQPLELPPTAAVIAPAATPPQYSQANWERLMGVNLPIWLGAITLSVAGFFLVKLAMDSGVFSPMLRVFACFAAALGFLAGAELVRRRGIANGPAIAGALAAAGIATLYAAVFVAANIYEMIPQSVEFVAMALVTALAIAIALFYGQIVAVIGLIGGYFAPAIVGGVAAPNAIVFAYLFALLIGSYAVIRLKGWWSMALASLLGPAMWILVGALKPEVDGSYLWTAMLAIGVPMVVTIAASRAWLANQGTVWLLDTEVSEHSGARRALAASFVLGNLGLASLLVASMFAFSFWMIFAGFAAASVALGAIRPGSMRYLKLISLATAVVVLPSWFNGTTNDQVEVIASLAVIFAAGALDQFRRLKDPVQWAMTIAMIAAFFYGLLLFKAVGWESAFEYKHAWALSSLALAALFAALAAQFGPRIVDAGERDKVYAVLCAAASGCISLAIILELDPSLYPVASALQVLGLGIVYWRTKVAGLRGISAVYAGLYGALIAVAAAGSGLGFFGSQLLHAGSSMLPVSLARSLTDAPITLLILPALAFLAAATLFRRSSRDGLAGSLDGAAVAMLAVGIYYLAAARHPIYGSYSAAWIYADAARIIGPEMLLALAAGYLGRRFDRFALTRAGIALTLLVSVSLLGLVVPVYQFWPVLELPGAGVFNVALLTLGLPAGALLAVGLLTAQRGGNLANLGRALSALSIFAIFTLMLVEIRFGFHPDRLQGFMASSEFYAYSVGMLAFGIGLLAIGIATRSLDARALSLVFVLATTVKVFMFDVAGLDGLWRIMSFLGMGIAFLGISWVYGRYVFGLKGRGPMRPKPIQNAAEG